MQWQDLKLKLECWPPLPEHIAKAWDAADEYLWQECDKNASTLIINDRYGALACALPHAQRWLDSLSAAQAAEHNLIRQQIHATPAFFAPDCLPKVKQVLIKVPKNFELLHFYLATCQAQLPEDTHYLLAGMAKHWPINWLKWLEEHSHYHQLPLLKKARLVQLKLKALPRLALWRGYEYAGIKFEALPGVFARDKLDIGSRVLLENTPHLYGDLCDLGCGNGLLGLSLAQKNRLSSLTLCDDSYLALRSAEHNAQQHSNLPIRCIHSDGLAQVSGQFDFILCNPPFHDGHKELTNIALRMFTQSQKQLKAGGALLVIANRHLPYLGALKKHFKRVDSLAADTRFSLYQCQN